MDRIHETGILGSLRWWYEAIVRGLGGRACDPTGDHRCPDKNGNYCDACTVFGATGLQRAFRLEGPEWWNKARGNTLKVRVKDNKGWFLGHGFLEEGEIQITPLRLPEGWGAKDLIRSLYLTMKLIECWGGLGPKTQQGYGVVKLDFREKEDIEKAIDAIRRLQNREKRRIIPDHKWPTLDGFFFAKARFSTDGQSPQTWIGEWSQSVGADFQPNTELKWYLNQTNSDQRQVVLPLTPIVRYHLRALIKKAKNNGSWVFTHEDRHHLMGELGRGSLIHVSHAYPVEEQWEFRIWGWIPETLPGGMARADVFEHLRKWLGVSKERGWHNANTSDNTLWSNVGLSSNNILIRWFTKQSDEDSEDFIKALLTNCEVYHEDTGITQFTAHSAFEQEEDGDEK